MSYLLANYWYESYEKIQNFSSVSLKIQKQRDMGCEYKYRL